MAFGALSLKGRALRWLAQRDHSRAELERKLVRHLQQQRRAADVARSVGHADAANATADTVDDDRDTPAGDAAQIAAALDALGAAGWLDDRRTAEAVRAAHAARYGSRRLQQTLRAKGIADDLVAAAVAASRGDEVARAGAIWRRRYGAPPADAAERARQMRFLAGRGFDADTVRAVLRSAVSASANADERDDPEDDVAG